MDSVARFHNCKVLILDGKHSVVVEFNKQIKVW